MSKAFEYIPLKDFKASGESFVKDKVCSLPFDYGESLVRKGIVKRASESAKKSTKVGK